MRQPSARCAVALATALNGCSGTAAIDRPPPAAMSTAAVADEAGAAAAVRRWLELEAVTNESPGRRVFYTWTSDAQVDELGKSRRLLVSPAGERARTAFDASLAALSYSVVAQLVALEPFQLRRYAWTNPWATSLGFGAERYGDRLVRVVLKPNAVVGSLAPGGAAFFGVDGKPVSESDVIRQPSRLAAVYHVRAAEGTEPPFREYVLVNESAIEEWSTGADSIRERVALDAMMLRRLGALVAARGARRARDAATWGRRAAEDVWPGGAANPTDDALYASGLAFASAPYALEPGALAAIAARLEALPPQGATLAHRPDVAFPRQLGPATPGRAGPCIRRGSQCYTIGGAEAEQR